MFNAPLTIFGICEKISDELIPLKNFFEETILL